MGRRLEGKPLACPVTESLDGQLLRLPFYVDLSAEDQDSVISALKQFDWSVETPRATESTQAPISNVG